MRIRVPFEKMKKIMEFFNQSKHAIIWTVAYFVVLYSILFLIFGFNLFSARHWDIVFNLRLHGFAGFVFCIILLASIPIYIATIKTVIKTGKPIFEREKKKAAEKKEEKKTTEETTTPIASFPQSMPRELHEPFLRSRSQPFKFSAAPVQSPSTQQPEQPLPPESTPEPTQAGLPMDFDFDAPTTSSSPLESSAPVFKEFSFGDSSDKKEPETDGIKVQNGFAVATHDDTDFWIADEDVWFASGKSKPSPVSAVIKFAAEKQLSPALHLVESNIMDLEARKKEWEEKGVKIISDLSEIG